MGLFDRLKNKGTGYSRGNNTPASNVLKTNEIEVKATERELTPDEIEYNHFNAAMTEEDTNQRRKEIEAITNQYWLSRLVREGKYETDRIQALQQLNDQRILLEIASESGNIPRIQSLAQDKLDDAHRLQFIKKSYIHVADRSRAAAKISDLEILEEIMLHAVGRDVQLAAVRRLEVIAPEEAKKYEDFINYLRRKF